MKELDGILEDINNSKNPKYALAGWMVAAAHDSKMLSRIMDYLDVQYKNLERIKKLKIIDNK